MAEQERIVLIIDDSPEDRATYRRYLLEDAQHHYTIIEEESGERGLELCRLIQPDSVLLDFLLPDLDGLEFLALLKGESDSIDLPIIMLTGQGNEFVAVQAMKSGVQDYLVKGQTTSEGLRLAVKNAIEKATLRQALQQSEERFRTSIENLLDAFGIYAAIREPSGQIIDFRVDYVNAVACESQGVTKEQLIGQRLCELLPGHREIGLFADYCQVVETGQPLVKECFIYLDPDRHQGFLKVFDIRASKLGDGCVVSWRDITNRKQAELEIERLRQIAERRAEELQILLDVIPIGIAIADDPDCQRIRMNPYLSNITRVPLNCQTSKRASQEEQLAEQRLGYCAKISACKLPMQYATAQRTEVRDFELDLVDPDGTLFRLLGYAAPLLDEQNDVRGCVGAFVDLTELSQFQQALQQSEELFRTFFEEAPIGIIVIDANYQIVKVNRAICEILDYSEFELIQQNFTDITYPEDREQSLQLLDRLFAGEISSYYLEKRYLKKNQELVWSALTTTKIYSTEDKICYCLGMIENITDRKQIEAERDELLHRERLAREQAESANHCKDEFLAMVSHELRSPLNTILGWSQLLRVQKYEESAMMRALEVIERNARAQLKLIEDLLDVSQIIRGELRLNLDLVNLTGTLTAVTDEVRPLAVAKNITVEFKNAPTEVWVAGDPNRLQQVVWNLLSNAVKFTPEGGSIELELSLINHKETEKASKQVAVQVQGEQKSIACDRYAQIQVRDTGKGISPEFLPFVFDRYRQADSSNSRSQKGLGLGLAIARQLVELHRGTVQVESPGVGQGSTFTVKLPLVEQS
ncbi:MAG: PAS domain S-box protein [Actinomycetota bacterium]